MAQAPELIPPRPAPLTQSRIPWWRFLRLGHSWLDVTTQKSYSMLLGQFWLPAVKVFVINDPAVVERMLITEPERYPKHRMMFEALEPLLGGSPFATSGPHWQRQRRMLDQAFGHARLNLVFPLMEQSCLDMLARLQDLPDGATLGVDDAMSHVTADIVHRTIFSSPLRADEADRLTHALARYQELAQRAILLRLFRLPTWGLGRACQRQATIIRGFLSARLAERYQRVRLDEERQAADILGGLRTAVDPVDGSSLTETEILDQICLLFLAGHETTASALSWCLYIFGESPELQSGVRQEGDQFAEGTPAKSTDVYRMPQLSAMFKEVLRLYPPVGYFMREAAEDQEIRGSKVPKGSGLMVCPWLLHRHRRWWERPDTLDPQRFGPNKTGNPIKGSYIPFGLGARACPGAGFAAQESALILSHLLRHYRLERVDGPAPEVVGRLTVRSDQGIKVRLHRLVHG